MQLRSFDLLIGSFLLFAFCSCDKDDQDENNTEIQIEIQNDTATTFILVRHAETTGIGSDPDLDLSGIARADELRRMLEHLSLGAVFSTDYERTMQTAEPTAIDQGLTVIEYDPSDLDQFIDSTLVKYDKEVILVVGHSNTTPDLLNILVGADEYGYIPDPEYDNMYIATVRAKGDATILHMKYGE